jgi:signal transduction histidine kinase
MALADRIGPLARTSAFRLAMLYVALFVTAATIVAAALIWRTNALLTDQVLRALRGERDELILVGEVRGLEPLAALVAERSRAGSGMLYFLSDSRSVKLAGNLSRRPPELDASQAGALFTYSSQIRPDQQRTAAGMATATPGGGLLILARDIEDQKRLLETIRRLFLWSFVFLVLLGLAGGILAGRLLLKRIESVSATSRTIMAGDLARRIPLAGTGDEIDDLAGHLNAMLDRIEQLMTGMREVSDNIAHDLKTPLNRLRGRAEAALRDERGAEAWREGLERTIEEADEIIKTFNALLLIARLEAGAVAESFDTFDLAGTIRDVAELYEPVAEEAHLALTVAPARGPELRANREMIGQAVANLIDNAIKYASRAGTQAPVEVRVTETAGGVEIAVADHGPGIRPEDRERALRRFVRLDESRSKPGTGLGLSLVAAVARLHGGSVRLEDNAPGLKATLVLPARLIISRDHGGPSPPSDAMREREHAATG